MSNVSGTGGPKLDTSLLTEKETTSAPTGQGQGAAEVPTHSVTSATSIEPSISQDPNVKQPTVSGTTATDTVSAATTNKGSEPATSTLGAPPTLPSASGSPNHETAGLQVGWLDSSAGSLMWAALSEMARTSMQDMKSAKDTQRAMQDSAVDSKKNKVKATEGKQKAEREEAVRNFQSSTVTAVIVCAVSCYGASKSGGSEDGGAKGDAAKGDAAKSNTSGQAIVNCANAVGNVYDSYSRMESKTGGAQRQADDKELEAMRWEMNAEMLDQMVEESKASHEEAKELFKKGLNLLTEHYELQTQAVQTYTRG